MHFHGFSEQEVSGRAVSPVSLPVAGIRHWAADYIGKPYVSGASGPHAFDCWGLLRHVYLNRYGIELPLLPGIADASALAISREIDLATHHEWEETQSPEDGYAVGMSQRIKFHHVGLVIRANGRQMILHALDHFSVIAEPVQRLRLRGFKRIGYFRHWLWPT